MPSGGEDRAAPPVRVWAAAARAELAVLMHGANFYSMGAGGFSTVPAMPQMVKLRQPANANRPAAVRASQLYTTIPLPPNRNQLQRQFGRI